jgi:signal transduction histidine kinase
LVEAFEKRGRVTDLEVDFTIRPGGVATMLVSMIPLTLGGVASILVIAHDITARKQSEEALLAAQAQLTRGIEARAALEERQRLARELHDSVSQALYGISLGINTARTLYDTNRGSTLEALDYAHSLTRAALAEMRALIFELRPESLENEGLVAALTKQADAISARHEIEVGLCLSEEPDISLSAKEALYRIAREALQNAVRHSQAGRIDVQMTCEPGKLKLEVCDHGVGFDPHGTYPGHLGLQSMRERAEGVEGSLEIRSDPECGTQVVVSIPMT